MIRKITKDEKNFLITHILFVIVCIPMYMDWTMMKHPNRFRIFNDFTFALISTTIFMLICFVFYMFSLKKTHENRSRTMQYLIMFLTIFICPMYFCDSYFGTRDIYGLLIMYLVIMMISQNVLLWLTVPMMFAAMVINPTGIMLAGVIVPILFLLNFLERGLQKKYIIYFAITIAVELIGFVLAVKHKMFAFDVQGRISSMRFLLILVLLIPVFIIGLMLFGRYFKKQDGLRKVFAGLVGVSGAPAFLIWALKADYTRSFVGVFIHYITLAMAFMIMGDESFADCVDETGDDLRRLTKMGGIIVLIYTLAVISLKVFGEVEVDTEKLLQLKVK